jgi:hypothetical protein
LNPTSAGGLSTTQPLPDQFNRPTGGVLPGVFTSDNAFRPESTFAAPGNRGDTHLWVVAGDGTANRPNVAGRADLQILADGRSSASVSAGGIMPMQLSNGNKSPLVLAGSTVGSTRLGTNQLPAPIVANFGSLATGNDGQSTHLLGGDNLNNGQISYFAVSQADPRLQSTDTNANPNSPPAQVQPGIAGATQFGYTRLATNVGKPDNILQPTGDLSLQGFASAVVEHTDSSQTTTVYALSNANHSDATITRTAANPNTFSARFALTKGDVGQLPSSSSAGPSTTLNFGDPGAPGPTPRSAFVTSSTFAAVGGGSPPGNSYITATTGMASIDGDLLNGIANRTGTVAHPVTGAPVNADIPASNEHLAWGFFLGDLADQANGQQQNNVNLGFWVAGRPVPASVMQSLTGTATYGGGLIGTAVDNNGVRSATGNFAQFWDFGARKGSMNANFDSRAWAGLQSSMPAGSNVFTGSGMSGNRLMSVQGAFFHNTSTGGTLSSSNLPAAIGGIFAVQGPAYGANGIMVGGRR